MAQALARRVAAPVAGIVWKGRPIGWREHRVEPADAHAAGAITRLLHELPRRRLLHQLAAHAARKAHQLVLHFGADRKSTRLNSSHQIISYAVFCLKKKK